MAADETRAVYVLTGKDALLRAEARQRLVDRLLGDADPQLAISVLDADAPPAAVFDELRTPPLLGPPHRVVIVRDADDFIAAHRDMLAGYLDRPASTGTLILLCDSLDKRTRFAKALKPPVAEVVECSAPEGPELIDWIRQRAKAEGKDLRGPVAEMLAAGIGADLATLRNEINKLATYVGDRPAITPEDVSAIVSASVSAEAFAIVNALIAGNARAALDALNASLTARGAEFAVLGQLAWHVRRALQVASAVADGQSPAAAMNAARIWRNQQRDFAALLQRRGLTGLRRDLRRLLAADLAMKSGKEPKPALQELVVALCA